MGRLRGSHDPKFVALGERLEKLRRDYEAGVIKTIQLKGLLDAAERYRSNRALKRATPVTEADNKQALTKAFSSTNVRKLPKLIGDMFVEQIDKIVKATALIGWQNSTVPAPKSKGAFTDLGPVWTRKDKVVVQKAYGVYWGTY